MCQSPGPWSALCVSEVSVRSSDCIVPLPHSAVMTLPVPHPDVIARALPDGSVLFHPLTEVYFGLNETGTVIWTALGAGVTSEDGLVNAVLAQWPDATPTDVTCHVRELLADLSIEGLVVDTVTSLG